MRSVIFGAVVAVFVAAAPLTSKPAQAMVLPAPAGLKGAIEQTDLTETVSCWDCRPYYRPYHRPAYGHRRYYRPYSYGYRPHYRPYRSYGHRPHYRTYSYGYRINSPYRVIYGPDGPGYYDPRNVGW